MKYRRCQPPDDNDYGDDNDIFYAQNIYEIAEETGKEREKETWKNVISNDIRETMRGSSG